MPETQPVSNWSEEDLALIKQGVGDKSGRPASAAAGEAPAGDSEQLNTRLRETMTSMLYRVQEEYPHPQGAYWVPRRLGGAAPTPEESNRLRAIELAERARKQGVSGL